MENEAIDDLIEMINTYGKVVGSNKKDPIMFGEFYDNLELYKPELSMHTSILEDFG